MSIAPESVAREESNAVLASVRESVAVLHAILVAGSDRSRMQRDALVAFAVRVASAAILYLSQIVLARWMGGFEYGVYIAVWTWVLVLGGLSHLGMNMAVIRLLPSYQEQGALELHRGLMRGSRWLAFSVGTAFALLAIGGIHFVGDRLVEPYVLPLTIALACIPMYAVTDVQDGIGRGKGWMSIALLPPYVLRPLTLLLVMVAAHLYGLPMEAKTAAAAAVLATWSTGLIQLILTNQRSRLAIAAGPRRYDFSAWLGISLPLLVIGACEIVMQTADVLIVSRYLSPTEVGIYFAAAKTMSLVLFVHYAVGSAAANRFATLYARGDRQALQPLVADAVKWTFWPSLAGSIVLLVFGWPLLRLFGPAFTEGYPVMFVLVLGFLFRAAMGPSEFLLNMMGQQKLSALILSVTAALNVSLNLALVPRVGLIGAACSTAAALMFAALMNNMVARRRLGLRLSIFSVPLEK